MIIGGTDVILQVFHSYNTAISRFMLILVLIFLSFILEELIRSFQGSTDGDAKHFIPQLLSIVMSYPLEKTRLKIHSEVCYELVCWAVSNKK